MNIPSLFTSVAPFQFLLSLRIIFLGIRQYILARDGKPINKSYVVPLGALCLVIGFLGFFIQVKQTFEAIEVAGDISPQIVASGIKDGYDFPIIGFIGLGLSYAFRFINSQMIENNSEPDGFESTDL